MSHKKWLTTTRRLVSWGLGLYLMGETLLWASLALSERRWVKPWEEVEFLVKARYQAGECTYLNTLMSHPYQGYVYHPDPPGGCRSAANNHHVSGPDHPLEKDPEEFVVFITGGSVAELLLREHEEEGHFTTRDLNRRFLPPPPYKRFRVIGAAIGGWLQPQQLMAVIFHQPEIDAVIDVEGYNELFTYTSNYFPVGFSMNTSSLMSAGGFVGFKRFNEALFRWVENWPWLKYLPSVTWVFRSEVANATLDISEEARVWGERWAHASEYPITWDMVLRKVRYHRSLLRGLGGLCETYGWKCAAFLQPIPIWKKSLVKSEEDFQRNYYARVGDDRERTRKNYAGLVEALANPSVHPALPVFDETGVFSAENGLIYRDHIHYAVQPGDRVARGNRLLWRDITSKIAKRWGFRPKP